MPSAAFLAFPPHIIRAMARSQSADKCENSSALVLLCISRIRRIKANLHSMGILSNLARIPIAISVTIQASAISLSTVQKCVKNSEAKESIMQ